MKSDIYLILETFTQPKQFLNEISKDIRNPTSPHHEFLKDWEISYEGEYNNLNNGICHLYDKFEHLNEIAHLKLSPELNNYITITFATPNLRTKPGFMIKGLLLTRFLHMIKKLYPEKLYSFTLKLML